MIDILKQHDWFRRNVARALGVVSVLMGGAAIAPDPYCRVFGLRAHHSVMRAIGIRDAIIGVGLLSTHRRHWLVLQASADLLDAALVAWWLWHGTIARRRGIGWLCGALAAAVLAIAAWRRP